MLYQFKSAAAGDVIMLEATAHQVLAILGKGREPTGILLAEQIPAAQHALMNAVAQEEAQTAQATAQGQTQKIDDQTPAHISLRRRIWPLLQLLEHSLKDKVPITWGV
jgi:hypothetical protein